MPTEICDRAIVAPAASGADAAENISEVRSQESLLKTGALQNAIFNSANFSSIATDANGVIQIFNVGAERMLGYAAAEVMNKITPADISDPHEPVSYTHLDVYKRQLIDYLRLRHINRRRRVVVGGGHTDGNAGKRQSRCRTNPTVATVRTAAVIAAVIMMPLLRRRCVIAATVAAAFIPAAIGESWLRKAQPKDEHEAERGDCRFHEPSNAERRFA